MKSFKKYIFEAAGKNTHMTHIEDAVLYGGVKGAKEAIFALRSLRDMLAGNSKGGGTDVTVKWDGAPAVFAGIDPADGQFFVAKKGIFNKDPKVYKSVEDVKDDTSGDLQAKLIVAFEELSKLGIKGVLQGDLMYTKSDLKTQKIDDVPYITFQPNTIVYAVPANSSGGKKIKASKMGVVFHTSYSGTSFENMKASFNVDISSLKSVPSVWYQDAKTPDLSGTALMDAAETKEVTAALSNAGKIFQKIAGSTLKTIENDPQLAQTLETYNNTFVRRSEELPADSKKHVDGLLKWSAARFEKERAKRKSERGKEGVNKREEEFTKFFSPQNKTNLTLIYDLQKAIVTAKLIIIKKLDSLKKIDTFIRTKNGFKLTGQEGFVAIDKTGGGAVKLVDRLEFSTNNFSSDVLKGWDH